MQVKKPHEMVNIRRDGMIIALFLASAISASVAVVSYLTSPPPSSNLQRIFEFILIPAHI
jgi:hypothetical protein